MRAQLVPGGAAAGPGVAALGQWAKTRTSQQAQCANAPEDMAIFFTRICPHRHTGLSWEGGRPPGRFRALVWFSGLNLLLVSVLWPGLEAQFMEHCRPAGSGGRDLAANAATNQTRNDEGVLALPCSSASFCVHGTV